MQKPHSKQISDYEFGSKLKVIKAFSAFVLPQSPFCWHLLLHCYPLMDSLLIGQQQQSELCFIFGYSLSKFIPLFFRNSFLITTILSRFIIWFKLVDFITAADVVHLIIV